MRFLNQLFGLKGKFVLVTGGFGRLGTEFTLALLSAGAHVCAIDKLKDIPSDFLGRIPRKFDSHLFNLPSWDISDERQAEEAADLIEGWTSQLTDTGINVLLNNAGWHADPNMAQTASVPFEEYPMDVWDEVFRSNMRGYAVCAKVFGSRMIAHRASGSIINVSSHYALVSPDPRVYEYKEKKTGKKFLKDPPYGASKAAILQFTRELAVQWAPNKIRVNAICPGGVRNPKGDRELRENYSQRVPLARMAEASEYNGAVIFLASDASSYMTGSTMVIDGGYSIW